jgi:prepilin-type N-terminal cleavage/methylation domain-containing protein
MAKLNSFKSNPPVRGFTLIELLVVIAIIGILSALLLPVLSKAKNRASQVTDLNNLKELTTAINLYCTDHDDIIVWPNWDNGDSDRQGWLYKRT